MEYPNYQPEQKKCKLFPELPIRYNIVWTVKACACPNFMEKHDEVILDFKNVHMFTCMLMTTTTKFDRYFSLTLWIVVNHIFSLEWSILVSQILMSESVYTDFSRPIGFHFGFKLKIILYMWYKFMLLHVSF